MKRVEPVPEISPAYPAMGQRIGQELAKPVQCRIQRLKRLRDRGTGHGLGKNMDVVIVERAVIERLERLDRKIHGSKLPLNLLLMRNLDPQR